jgi:CheY-like chemotaxis protein
MPGMDGFEVIRHVREQATLNELPILVVTAQLAEELERLQSTYGCHRSQRE